MGKPTDTLYKEREERVYTAIGLQEPDRVPVILLSGFFPAYHAGITCREAMYDVTRDFRR